VIAHQAGQCTTCGACEAVCPLLAERSLGFVGPMRVVVSGMRGGTLSFAADESLRIMAGDDCRNCGLCETSCPEKIPMTKLAGYYLAQIEEVRALQ
jgi:succinate dehydrogenase/fumarate reductase-like Fe-S protein